MLIASKFKRPKAPIDLGGTIYHFVPIDPANPDSEHVADVVDGDHIQRLLAIPEGYYLAQAQSLQTVGRPLAPAAPPSAPPVVPPAADNAGGAPQSPAAGGSVEPVGANLAATLPPELVEAAAALNGLSWQKLRTELAKGGIQKAVLKAALDLELARPDPDQRQTTIKLITAALGAD